MTRESIKAAEIWLKKHLPDLKSVEVNYGDSPLKIRTITTTIKRAGE